MTWSEGKIARAIALQTLARKCVVLVDNCNWTGHECDVLAVTADLRIIDVEVKISRADLKADAKKDKWWRHLPYKEAEAQGIDTRTWNPWAHREPVEWPRKVWKHYYALPREIWNDMLFDALPTPRSGVLLLSEQRSSTTPIAVHCIRRAQPNKDADRLKPEHVIDIARLANLRMWEAYRRGDALDVAKAA
jgi:hypothetical protein